MGSVSMRRTISRSGISRNGIYGGASPQHSQQQQQKQRLDPSPSSPSWARTKFHVMNTSQRDFNVHTHLGREAEVFDALSKHSRAVHRLHLGGGGFGGGFGGFGGGGGMHDHGSSIGISSSHGHGHGDADSSGIIGSNSGCSGCSSSSSSSSSGSAEKLYYCATLKLILGDDDVSGTRFGNESSSRLGAGIGTGTINSTGGATFKASASCSLPALPLPRREERASPEKRPVSRGLESMRGKILPIDRDACAPGGQASTRHRRPVTSTWFSDGTTSASSSQPGN
jgi:hypothetical protein